MARRSGAAGEVADELEQAAGTFLEHPYANVFKAMGVAVATLDPEIAAAYGTMSPGWIERVLIAQ